jgi:hypothetical protein
MTRSTKIGLTILSSVILISWLLIFFKSIFPIVKFVREGGRQMVAGQKYMDSLTEKDFQIWTERTQKYLTNFNQNNWTMKAAAVPPELAELKILRIDEDSNWVNYVWMGGFDHTMLHVERLNNNQFEFTAIYNDESNRVIWPK